MTRYAVALGSNLGDRAGHLRAAIDSVSSFADVTSVSPLYETEPIGGPEQGPYLNAVAVIDTGLDAQSLLRRLQAIETARDRVREVVWGPRTLDLDIVAIDGDPVDQPGLVIPHPRAVERRFVLQPLAEVWPDAVVAPGLTASAALGSVGGQEVELLSRRWIDGESTSGKYWVAGQLALFAAIGVSAAVTGSLPPVGGPGAGRIAGAAVALLGLILMFASGLALGPGLTALPEPLPGANLVASGPYRLVRHPMYLGVFLLFLGVSVFFASWLAAMLSLGLVLYFGQKARFEERRLRIAYPTYSSYRLEVRHRIIPFIW